MRRRGSERLFVGAFPVRIAFGDREGSATRAFSGATSVITFGSGQYRWRPNGPEGRADPDGPPVRSTVAAGTDTVFDLPAASITVIRGTPGPASPR